MLFANDVCVKKRTVCVEFPLFCDCIFKNTEKRDTINALTRHLCRTVSQPVFKRLLAVVENAGGG